MNRILHWLTVKLSRPTAAETIEQPGSDYEERGFSEEDNPGEPVTIGKVQTDIDDLTPNIYREATGDTQRQIINQFLIPGHVHLERFCCSIDRLVV